MNDPTTASRPDVASGSTPETGTAPDQVGDAVAFVLRSTRQRPQTEAELRDKLAERGVASEVVQEALAQARSLGATDDRAFARAWVRDRGQGRGYGALRLRQELLRRRVPDHLVDEALATLEDRDEESVAEDLARERAARFEARIEPDRAARRLAGFLQRRGYPPALAQRVAIRVSGLDRDWD
ncbi:regulatory protein RecX [Egibacter rhizosphaerae]|uniref:regulatory protein RecX n=1 Tax=Egibacter rhizosphaerae TaxID=1670831 RepID=UPI0013F145DA|nr:regulatory protein RecX [Egibacter rhizosphaerae]